mgnify:CR=1 FL=1
MGLVKTNLDMVSVLQMFGMSQEVNAHGKCWLEGIVADGCKDDFVKENNSQKRVTVTVGETTVFAGVLNQISVYQDGNVYKFKILLNTCSILMDLKKKRRSFQNKDMTYKELVQEIVGAYDGGDVIDNLSGGKETGTLLVQYDETDWEFLMRLASRFNGSVVPAGEFSTPKLFFGAVKEKHMGELGQHSYSMEKTLLQYKKWNENGYSDYMESDSLMFKVESREYYEVGSGVMYRNAQLYIGKMEAELVKGEVIFRYELRTKQGMGQQKRYADRLLGASIEGEVLESVKDKIKVKLEIDETQDVGTAWEFPYQTMYTADGQGGWYCMPEKGDRVMIYFPSGTEADAAGSSSSRSPETNKRTESPQIKFFRTIYGKEIRFTEDAVEIICSDRDSGKVKSRVVLHQDTGIELFSKDKISISSGKGIRLEAEDEIELLASDMIRLHCKKSRIQMDSMIDIAGPDVRIN